MRDNYGKIIKSENIINKKAKGIDNIDLGEIQKITSEGSVNLRYIHLFHSLC